MEYWLSAAGEYYTHGPYKTRKQACKEAVKLGWRTWHVGAAEYPTANALWHIDAERVAEQAGLNAADWCGTSENCDDYGRLDAMMEKGLQFHLDKAISFWVSQHKELLKPTFFRISNPRQYPATKAEVCECDGWCDDSESILHRIMTGHATACPHYAKSAVV